MFEQGGDHANCSESSEVRWSANVDEIASELADLDPCRRPSLCQLFKSSTWSTTRLGCKTEP